MTFSRFRDSRAMVEIGPHCSSPSCQDNSHLYVIETFQVTYPLKANLLFSSSIPFSWRLSRASSETACKQEESQSNLSSCLYHERLCHLHRGECNFSESLFHQKGSSQVLWHPKMFQHQKYLRQRKEYPSSCQCAIFFETEESASVVNTKGMATFSLILLTLGLFITFFPWNAK